MHIDHGQSRSCMKLCMLKHIIIAKVVIIAMHLAFEQTDQRLMPTRLTSSSP